MCPLHAIVTLALIYQGFKGHHLLALPIGNYLPDLHHGKRRQFYQWNP